MTTNNIATKQKEASAIELLRAQRHIYGVGKWVAGGQALVAVGAPLFSVCAGLFVPALRPHAALTALLGVILDVLVLDPWQKIVKGKAAKVQESFDCQVLELPWNDFKVGGRADPEDEHSANVAHLRGTPDPSLENWYPAAVAELPLHQGRIVCQRANLRWDAELRRGYANAITGILALASTGALYFALFGQLTVEQFVLRMLAPLTPLLVWGIREQYRQREAAGVLDRLKEQIERLWQRALKGTCDEAACTAESRLFQDQMFDHRRSSPLVFEWIYRLRRGDMEAQMNAAADHFLKEAQEETAAERR